MILRSFILHSFHTIAISLTLLLRHLLFKGPHCYSSTLSWKHRFLQNVFLVYHYCLMYLLHLIHIFIYSIYMSL